MKKLFAGLLFALWFAAPASAQTARVVPVCSTLPQSYAPGATRDITQDINGNTCIAGTFSQTGGTVSNATSGQATTATNQGAVAYLYGFNGTTWDQLQVDGSKQLKVIDASVLAAIQAAIPPGTNRIGYVTDDPCSGAAAKAFLPVTATTSLVKVIAPGVAAKKITICQINLTVAAADNVAVFEATTGTTCATSPVAVYGAGTSVATAGNGYNFPANGGISLGNGAAMVGQTTVNNNDLCIGTSAATPLTGGITYVTQ